MITCLSMPDGLSTCAVVLTHHPNLSPICSVDSLSASQTAITSSWQVLSVNGKPVLNLQQMYALVQVSFVRARALVPLLAS